MALHQRVHRISHPAITGTARLTYYIFEGILVGNLGSADRQVKPGPSGPEGRFVYLSAWSGGAGGSRKLPPQDSANNPYEYGLKEKGAIRGGPIPPGTYRIFPPSVHPTFKLSARLEPLQKVPNNRGGFFIHGRGPKGSDGCIVLNDSDHHPIMNALARSRGGLLVVCEAVDGAFA